MVEVHAVSQVACGGDMCAHSRPQPTHQIAYIPVLPPFAPQRDNGRMGCCVCGGLLCAYIVRANDSGTLLGEVEFLRTPSSCV